MWTDSKLIANITTDHYFQEFKDNTENLVLLQKFRKLDFVAELKSYSLALAYLNTDL